MYIITVKLYALFSTSISSNKLGNMVIVEHAEYCYRETRENISFSIINTLCLPHGVYLGSTSVTPNNTRLNNYGVHYGTRDLGINSDNIKQKLA